MSKIKEIIKKEKCYSLIIILIASIFICIPLMSSKIDITYDDGVQHIARLMGTYQSICEGQIYIMSNFCNGFGYSWNLFYSPLTAFLPLIFKIFGASYIVCIKLFMFLTVFLSGYFMYLFTKKITKNNNVALLSGLLYIFTPYRLTDMYIRNALAELTSFVFIPLIFMGLYNALNEKDIKKSYILSVGSIGLFLTHSVVTMYVAILAFIYLLTNIKKINKNTIKKLLINILIILIITSFFWVPLIQHKIATEYEVFKEGRMERTEVLTAYKLNFYRLFFTKSNDYMIYDIGIITIIGLVLTPISIKKIRKEKYYNLYLYMLIMGIILSFMTLKIFPFEKLPKILKMIQFTFRLLEFTGFFFAFVASINIWITVKNFKLKEVLVILIILSLLTIPYKSKLRYVEDINVDRIWETVPITENTGRVHAGCASFEYLPSKAFENRNYIETRNQDVIVISGDARIINKDKKGHKLSFDIDNISDETSLELPYIYYLGYDVTFEENDKKVKLKTFETDNGFVGINVPTLSDGSVIGTITVKYKGTTAMHIANFTSLIGFCYLVYVYIKKD